MAASPAIPEKIGRYEIRGVLGEGSQGLVFKAYDPIFRCDVAIKGINTNSISDPRLAKETRDRMHREAIAARKVAHSNVATLFDCLDVGDRTYLVMEFVGGRTLGAVLQEDRESIAAGGPGVPLEEKLGILEDVCEGLDRAHRLGVIHRDIKPDNIKLTEEGQPKILDFGLARVGDSSSASLHRIMGTPAYMSPEQWGSGEPPSHQADIWACGVILYEMLAHRRPYEGDPRLKGWERSLSIMEQVRSEEPTPIETYDKYVPEELKRIVARALQKNPRERYPSVEELSQDLRKAIESLEETKPLLQERLWKESAELEEEVRDRRDTLDESRAKALFDLSDAVDKKLWVLFTRDPSTPSTIVSKPKSYSELVHELHFLEQQRHRLQEVIALAEDMQSFREEVDRLRREDAGRTEPFDDSKLQAALAVVDRVLARGPSALEPREARNELLAEIEARKAEREVVGRVTELLEEGRLEQALKVAEEGGPAPPGSHRYALRQRIFENLEQRRTLTTRIKEVAVIEKEGRLEEALQQARAVIESCGDHAWLGGVRAAAKALAARVEVEIDRTQAAAVQQRVQTLFATAEELTQTGEHRSALEKLNELLSIDRDHGAALELRARLESLHQRGQALRRARAEAAEGHLQRAIDVARRALGEKSVSNDELSRQLESHIQRWEDLIQEAAELARDASSARASGHLERARGLVARALELYPRDAGMLSLRKQIEDELKRARRFERVRTLALALWKRRLVVFGLAALLALGTVTALNWNRLFPPPVGSVWLDVAPWAEILWVREAGSQRPVEVETSYAPCWLSLPAGTYQIGLGNALVLDEPYVMSITIEAAGQTTIQETLPGFDPEAVEIDF